MADNTRDATLRSAIEACINPDDEAIAALGDLFTEDVSVWSPNLLATGLTDLARSLVFREGAFSDVEVQIDAVDVFGNKGFAEFRVSADFTGPFFVGDDLAIEPNGQRLLLGAAVAAEFDGAKITALRAYFDDSTLLEQMIAA